MRVAAALFALVAVGCMSLAIVGMVTGRPNARVGMVLRAVALGCFALTVVFGVLAH
jgi:hypothetical protein